MARRRVRKRFVLVLLAATLLAGMLAVTGWSWAIPSQRAPSRSVIRYDRRAIECNGRHLWVFWIFQEYPGVPQAGGSAAPIEVIQKQAAAYQQLNHLRIAELTATKDITETSAGFRSVAPGGWVWGCRLWLVRSALGGLLALTLWGAWLMRPRWPVGACQKCGYDRAGLAASAVCPECGAAALAR